MKGIRIAKRGVSKFKYLLIRTKTNIMDFLLIVSKQICFFNFRHIIYVICQVNTHVWNKYLSTAWEYFPIKCDIGIWMWNVDKGRGGGGQPMWIGFLYVLGLFKDIFGLFNLYSVVFGLFLPKTEGKIRKYLQKIIFKKNNKNSKCG